MAIPRTTIARLRWHRGLTQRELAALSGVSIKTIEKIEAGQSKGSPRTALLLAGPLAVDVRDIVEALVRDYRRFTVDNNNGQGATGEQDGELTRAAEA